LEPTGERWKSIDDYREEVVKLKQIIEKLEHQIEVLMEELDTQYD
jgi:peptidoglycan hydrolase CwlO-like protein